MKSTLSLVALLGFSLAGPSVRAQVPSIQPQGQPDGSMGPAATASAKDQAPIPPGQVPPDASGQQLAEPNLNPLPPQAAQPPIGTMRHAPRVGAIALGWMYSPISYLPLSADNVGGKFQTQGLRVDGKFGWQVGGFTSRYASYVGFMAGFYYNFGGMVADSLGIDYGVFAKHMISPGPRVRGFLSYGLGATQVWVRQLGGRGIGHVTRLSGGVDIKMTERIQFELELAYQFNILATFAGPQAEPSRSYDFHALNLTAGLWFGK